MNTKAVCRSAMVLGVFVGAMLPRTANADSLARELVKVTPEVLKYLHEQEYQSVGVLKFRAKKGAGKLSDSVGTINSTMADRVETALLLALDPNVKNPLGLINDASAVARELGNPSYLSVAGRRRLFSHTGYPIRWGGRTAAPDAFLSGVVCLPDDRAVMEVALYVFDKNDKMRFFESFEADLTPNLMAETGRDFLILRNAALSKLAKQGKVPDSLAFNDHKTQQTAKQSVLQSKDSPVELIVYYDGVPVPYRLSGDKTAEIPEPRENQKVHFELVKRDNSPVVYGAVLKVNGENTLFKQTKDPPLCRKWILDRTGVPTVIRGYQLDDGSRERFHIATPEESKAKEIQYGRDVGQISLSVFVAEEVLPADLPPAETTPLPEGTTPSTVAAVELGKAAQGKGTAKDLATEQFETKGNANTAPETRGLIVPGEVEPSKITRVTFKPGRMVMSATIRYYKP